MMYSAKYNLMQSLLLIVSKTTEKVTPDVVDHTEKFGTFVQVYKKQDSFLYKTKLSPSRYFLTSYSIALLM